MYQRDTVSMIEDIRYEWSNVQYNVSIFIQSTVQQTEAQLNTVTNSIKCTDKREHK